MNSAMLVPIVVNGEAWGLVEIYDMRLRRYDDDETAVAAFLVGQAARRIESLGAVAPVSRRLLPVFRMPFARKRLASLTHACRESGQRSRPAPTRQTLDVGPTATVAGSGERPTRTTT